MYRRVRSRHLHHLVRGALLRVWPFSDVAQRVYRRRMTDERWDAVNSRAKAQWGKKKPSLDAPQMSALEELRAEGIHITDTRSLLGADFDLATLKCQASQMLESPEIRRQIK